MKTILFFSILFCFVQAPLEFAYSPNVRLLPSGETIIYSPIILSSGESLIGSNSTLKLADGANCPVIIIGDPLSDPGYETTDVYISGINIKGNSSSQRHEGWGGDPNVSNKHAIRNSGIVVRRASKILIDKVSVDGATSGGIVIERGCRDVSVINCKLSSSVFDGVAVYESENIFISDSTFTGNGFAGISADLNFKNSLVSNCVASNNGAQGIFLRHSRGNTFINMTISDNLKQGVFLAKSELPESEAMNNIFFDISFSKNPENFRINDKECLNNALVRPRILGTELVNW